VPKKNILLPVTIASAQSLSSSFTSTPTTISYTDNIAYQINVTTSNSIGTFKVQGSLDYRPNDPMTAPGVNGNWADLTLSSNPTVNAANDTILINLNQVPYNAVRISYTASTPGTGTCSIIIEAKGLS
jgi:hypothetical protein